MRIEAPNDELPAKLNRKNKPQRLDIKKPTYTNKYHINKSFEEEYEKMIEEKMARPEKWDALMSVGFPPGDCN
jgi:hypothetical protein